MSKNYVLFVDDESNILSAIRRAVIDEEFVSLFANSAQEAMKIMEEKEISVLVTDMRMPGMDGLTMLKTIKDIYPDMIKIVLSGYTQISQVLATVNEGDIYKFIAKPWKMDEELISGVRKGIEYYNLKKERAALKHALEQKNIAYQNVLKSMEEKMSSLRKDMELTKKLNEWTFEFLLTHSDETENITYLREISRSYLDMVPTVYGLISIPNIVKELQESFSSFIETKQLIIKGETENEIFANAKLISWIIRLLLLQVLKIEDVEAVQGKLEAQKNNSGCSVHIVLKIKNDSSMKKLLMDEMFCKLIFLIGVLNGIANEGNIVINTKELTKNAYALLIDIN